MTTEKKTAEECSELATSNFQSPLPQIPAVPTYFPTPPATRYPQRYPTQPRPQRPQTRVIRQEVVVYGAGRGVKALEEQVQVTEAPLLLAFPAKGEVWVGALGLGGPEAAEAGGSEPINKDAITVNVGSSKESCSPSRTLSIEAIAVYN